MRVSVSGPLDAKVASSSPIKVGSLSGVLAEDDARALGSTMENGLVRLLEGGGIAEDRLLRG